MNRADFWKLLVESRLLSSKQCQLLQSQFSRLPGSPDESAKPLATWLVRQNAISKYQATVLLAGRTGPFLFGDYRVYDRLDAGSRLAGLFRAVHVSTNHPVLLKFLAGAATPNSPAWEEMRRWIPLTDHPHVHRCHEAVAIARYRFLVLEDLRGQTLAEFLAASGSLAAGEACRLGQMGARALTHLHGSGRVHGDVRPHNLWLEPTGNLKLLVEPDVGTRTFQLATASQDPDGLARADYAAPEFLQPDRSPDPLTDIYALGCTLYELVAGRPPFPGGSVQEKLRRHASEPIQPLVSLGIPPALQQLIAYALAKNPAVRTQQASTLAHQLAPFASSPPDRQATPSVTRGAYEEWLREKAGSAPTAASQDVLPAAAMAPAPVVSSRTAPPSPPAMASPAVAPSPSRAAAPADSAGVVVRAGPVSPQPAPVPEITPHPTPSATPTSPVPATAAATAPPSPVGQQAAPVLPAPVVAAPVVAVPVVAVPPGSRTPAGGSADQAAELARRRARVRRRNNLIFLGISLTTVVAAVVAGVISLNSEGPPAPVSSTDSPAVPGARPLPADAASPAAEAAPPPVPPPLADAPAAHAAAQLVEVVPDDGQLLWASPTQGPPIDLRYVPSGAPCYLVARPAELSALPEGERMLKALGPSFVSIQAAWESRSGIRLAEIEQLIIAFYGNDGDSPRTVSVIRLSQDAPRDELLTKWGNPAPVEGLEHVYQKGELAFHLPPADPRTIVLGPLEPELRDAASTGWKPPLLRRELGRLLQTSDSHRQLTVLFAPNFLFGDGRALFAGRKTTLLDPLEWFLGDGLRAGLFSLHVADTTYLEIRMEGDSQTDKYQLAHRLRERLSQIPQEIELYVARLNPPPYWRMVANRYPAMIRFLHQQARVGVEGTQAAVNAVLPERAAHNLVFGGEMLVASTPALSSPAASPTAAPAAPTSITEVLASRISIMFAQDSLEFAMQNVADEVKSSFPALPFDFKIKILGPDLEKDGITRNQQVRDFDLKNQTVADVLTAMVRKANPITTVKDPSELDQKLVWAVGPDPEVPTSAIVLITTRTGAELRKMTLPEVFRPK